MILKTTPRKQTAATTTAITTPKAEITWLALEVARRSTKSRTYTTSSLHCGWEPNVLSEHSMYIDHEAATRGARKASRIMNSDTRRMLRQGNSPTSEIKSEGPDRYVNSVTNGNSNLPLYKMPRIRRQLYAK
jgi:hypothetical protein